MLLLREAQLCAYSHPEMTVLSMGVPPSFTDHNQLLNPHLFPADYSVVNSALGQKLLYKGNQNCGSLEGVVSEVSVWYLFWALPSRLIPRFSPANYPAYSLGHFFKSILSIKSMNHLSIAINHNLHCSSECLPIWTFSPSVVNELSSFGKRLGAVLQPASPCLPQAKISELELWNWEWHKDKLLSWVTSLL